MNNDKDFIELHTRSGRPLGCADFVQKLEVITGEELAPKTPGRKPVIRKWVYCPLIWIWIWIQRSRLACVKKSWCFPHKTLHGVM